MNFNIRIDLIKLADGQRLLRLEDATSGLSLEKRLDPVASVASQKTRWLRAFESMLEREAA
jgi:hypothetical protein